LLGEECLDWDIVTPVNAHTIARQLADTLGGHYVHMHEKASRVVVFIEDTGSPDTKQEMHIDISPLIGKTIEDDLYHRDFTINAIAAPLDQVVQYLASDVTMNVTRNVGATLAVARGTGADEPGTGVLAHETGAGPLGTLNLIGPLHGLADLQARRLKAVDDHIFRHDPLRMLRAVRLMMRYQLQIEPWTESLIRRDAGLLPEVAPERVHDELYAILGPDGAASRLHFLDEQGLFMVIFPEFAPARGMRQPHPHYWDVLTHSIETVAVLEHISTLIQGNTDLAGDPHHTLPFIGAPT
jgi:poly(A) polymerase